MISLSNHHPSLAWTYFSSWIPCHIFVIEKGTHSPFQFCKPEGVAVILDSPLLFLPNPTYHQVLLILFPKLLPLSISLHLPYHQSNLTLHHLSGYYISNNSLLVGLTPHVPQHGCPTPKLLGALSCYPDPMLKTLGWLLLALGWREKNAFTGSTKPHPTPFCYSSLSGSAPATTSLCVITELLPATRQLHLCLMPEQLLPTFPA